jgi:acetylglutamate kinase
MIPKVEAALAAAAEGTRTVVLDGRRAHALREAIDGQAVGTVIA